MASNELVDRLLCVLEYDVLPLTASAVERGNKIFGAAILAKSDLALIATGTNEETRNPLFHGEISALNRFWELPDKDRPAPEECIFLSTHEPCPLCLSAITWSGFDNFYFFFSYEDSRDAFAIPHDLNILTEVFGCREGNYRSENAYWRSYPLMDLIRQAPPARQREWTERAAVLRDRYDALSGQYQRNKQQQKNIPLT